jgi:hypothetical protein
MAWGKRRFATEPHRGPYSRLKTRVGSSRAARALDNLLLQLV